MTGQTISHYEILEKLGEGGMGAVYKARDSLLERFVALKILLPGKVIGEDRRARFVQEARAASALNHPNIIIIHEIASANSLDFITMEFVRGHTLDQVIGRKGLNCAETLKYAVQIADALAAAHAAGIVHRDLKPGNIMISDKGLVKVLDFGLAKLTEPAHLNDSTATETVKLAEAPRTEEGMIMGTVAYMSPEQAEGKKVDARADIFSFVAVLYEMVTGRRAFHGETKLSTLSAILKEDPPAPGTLAAGVPRELERIIARCLRKDPARRFQLMEDVKIALEELKEESDSGTLMRDLPAAVRPTRPTIPRWILPAAALLLALGGAAWWWFGRTQRPAQRPAARLTRLTSDAGLTTDPALSPDGKLVTYASDRSGDGNLDIWMQQVATGESVRLTRHEADEYQPTFSPDGSTIVFRSDRDGGGIWSVSALGGEPRPIVKQGRDPKFSPDGAWIAYWVGQEQNTPAQMFVISAAGGAPRRVRPDFAAGRSPVWSPDGKHLLFHGTHDITRGQTYEWWVTPIEGGEAVDTGVVAACRKLGISGVTGVQFLPGAWTPAGVIVFARLGDSANVWRVPLSARTFRMAAEPERITFGAGEEIKPAVAGGRLVFSNRSTSTDVWSCASIPPAANSSRSPSGSRRTERGKRALAFRRWKKGGVHLHEVGKSRRLGEGLDQRSRDSRAAIRAER